jgi:hypothetical protein
MNDNAIVDPSTLPVWQQKLHALAKQTADSERAPGQFFGTKACVLTFNKMPIPKNTMDVVVTAGIFENAYYPNPYDPNVIESPTCFAYGVADDEGEVLMVPHPSAHIKQAAACDGCPRSKFGTAKGGTGKGKACRNLRRLSVLPAGATTSADGVKKGSVGFVRLAVYSALGWADYVRKLALDGKSPYSVITKMTLVPDGKAQFKFIYAYVADITDPEVLEAIMTRHDFDLQDLQEPYPAPSDAGEQFEQTTAAPRI